MALGIYIVRWRRRKADLPEPEFKAWHVVITFNILIQLYLLIMPWYPPAGGQYAGMSASGMPHTLLPVSECEQLSVSLQEYDKVNISVVFSLARSTIGFGHSFSPSGRAINYDRSSSNLRTAHKAIDSEKFPTPRWLSGMLHTMRLGDQSPHLMREQRPRILKLDFTCI